VQGDFQWDQQKGGHAYNSDSSTHLLVGNESLKTSQSNVSVGDAPNVRVTKYTLFMFAPRIMRACQKEWRLREPCGMYGCFTWKRKSSSRLLSWTMTPLPRVSYDTLGNSLLIWEFLTSLIGQGLPLEQRKMTMVSCHYFTQASTGLLTKTTMFVLTPSNFLSLHTSKEP
jgi:hypothetical protein